VEIRLIDAPTQKVLSQKSLNQATIEQVATQLPGLSQELMAPLLREQQGFLVVKSREEAAEVLVDDTLVGSIPLKGSIDLSRGVHRLTVRKDGFIAQTRSVRIEPKQTTVEEVELAPSSDYANVYKDKYGKMRVGAWIATGVAIAGITTAVVMNASASSQYDDEFKPRQAWLQGAAGTGPQTKPPEIANNPAASAAWDSCTATGAAACKQAAEDAKSSVQVKQYVAIGAGVIGIASAGVATWLWLSGRIRTATPTWWPASARTARRDDARVRRPILTRSRRCPREVSTPLSPSVPSASPVPTVPHRAGSCSPMLSTMIPTFVKCSVWTACLGGRWTLRCDLDAVGREGRPEGTAGARRPCRARCMAPPGAGCGARGGRATGPLGGGRG
jgi:hypothetical protein